MDNMARTDNRQILDNATLLRKQNQYEDAIILFKSVWSAQREVMTEWDCWSFALCLRKSGQIKFALEVCKFVYTTNTNFKMINTQYAWCIYALEIKGIRPSEISDEVRLLNAVKKISQLTEQDKYSPVERSIMAYLRYLTRKTNIPYAQVLYWSDRLDPNLLQSEPLSYEGEDGKQIEYPSYKELWYSYRTKALDKLNRHKEALSMSKTALQTLPKFHHKNDTWFRWRIAKAHYNLGQFQEAIEIIEIDPKLKSEWYVQDLLSQIHFDMNDIETSLKYACEASLNHGERKNKYKLFLRMSELFEIQNDMELSRLHLELASVAQAEQPTDRLPNKLEQAMYKFGMLEVPKASTHSLYKKLNPIWQRIRVSSLPSSDGKIVRIFQHGKSGFIKGNDGKSHYFYAKSFEGKSKKMEVNIRVNFHIKPSVDPKTGRPSTEAVHIIPVSEV